MLCLPHDPCNRSLQPVVLLIRLYPTKKYPLKYLQHERENFCNYHGQLGYKSTQIVALSKSSTLVLEHFSSSCIETTGEVPPCKALSSTKQDSSKCVNVVDIDAAKEVLEVSTRSNVESFHKVRDACIEGENDGHNARDGGIGEEIDGYIARDGGFDVENDGYKQRDGAIDGKGQGFVSIHEEAYASMDPSLFTDRRSSSNRMASSHLKMMENSSARDSTVMFKDLIEEETYSNDDLLEIDEHQCCTEIHDTQMDFNNGTNHEAKSCDFVLGSANDYSHANKEKSKQVVNLREEEVRKPTVYNASYSYSDNNATIIRMPTYRAPFSKVSESVIYLKSLGADCSRILQEDPSIGTCEAKYLRALVAALEGYGLKWQDLGRIFNLCPKILRLDPETDLKMVTSFLFEEVGLARKDFAKVIKRCPRLLGCSVEGQLLPTLKFLRQLGFRNMSQVVCTNATLLSFSVENKILPKLKYLESIGFSSKDVVSMIIRFPAIFNYSVKENLQPKYEYLVNEMGRCNRDLLAFPQYFGYSLERKIRPRYERLVKQGVSLSLQAMLKLSEAEFNAKFDGTKEIVHDSKDVLVPNEAQHQVPDHFQFKDVNCTDLDISETPSFENYVGNPILVGALCKE